MRLRAALMALVREEMAKARPMPSRNDMIEVLIEDGLDKRVQFLGRTISKPEHQREVLRIAGLLAHVSDGVSDVERDVLTKLAPAALASSHAFAF